MKQNEKDCVICGNSFKQYTTLDRYCSVRCSNLGVDSPTYEKMKKRRVAPKSKALGKAKVIKIKRKTIPRYNVKSRTSENMFTRRKTTIRKRLNNEKGYLYCECCGRTQTARWEIHHIIYRSEKPNHLEIHSFLNLIHLAQECHIEFHEKKGRRNELVRQRGLDLLFGNDVLDK